MANSDLIATLRSSAQAAAQKLCDTFSNAVITSALRDLQAQAHAMATNVIKNAQWIEETYVQSPVRDACQTWVDMATAPQTVDSITAGLQAVLSTFTPDDLHHLSWHLTGDAFDVEPDGPDMQAFLTQLVADHVAAGGHAKYLTSEGGLSRWHVQLSPLI